MAPYNQYNHYYDPTGSQSSQPQGYTYQQQTPLTNAQYNNQSDGSYSNNNYGSYGSHSTGDRSYGASSHQNASDSTAQAASGLTSLTQRAYSGQSVTQSSVPLAQYPTSSQSGLSNTYTSYMDQSQNGGLHTTSGTSLYGQGSGSVPTATFGRLSMPDQTNSSTFGQSQASHGNTGASSLAYGSATTNNSVRNAQTYQPSQTQAQPHLSPHLSQPPQAQEPRRYASPLHAVQAQQHTNHQRSTSSTGAGSNKASGSSARIGDEARSSNNYQDAVQTTVNPSQVYNMQAEQQRKAQIEAEKQLTRETERAAREAEENARKAEEQNIAAEKQKEEEALAKKKAAQDKKNEQKRKSREEKRKSKTAATALQQLASGSGTSDSVGSSTQPLASTADAPADDEESEMRAMFKKMREFNAKNPSMLAKLWEEERKAHQPASQTQAPTQPETSPAAQQSTTPAATTSKAALTTPRQTGSASKTTSKSRKSAASAPAPPPENATLVAAVISAPPVNQLWPPHKKDAISEAAVKHLGELPENKASKKSIKPRDIVNCLDGNPTYVQLCEFIEKQGLKFERSMLARHLLKAVPDLSKTQPVPSAVSGSDKSRQITNEVPKINSASLQTSVNGGSVDPKPAATVQYSLSTFAAPADINSHTVNGGPATQAIMQTGNTMSTPGAYPTSASTPDGHAVASAKIETPAPSLPPADKEEAARKRTFGDLVDLTQVESDDEMPPPPKMQFAPIMPPHGPAQFQAPPPPGLMQPVPYQQFMHNPMGLHQPPPFFPHQQGYTQSMPPYQPQQNMPDMSRPAEMLRPPTNVKPPSRAQLQHERAQADRMRGRMLVEPIMRDRVARKSVYDSRTIARDILLATGRHPDMRSLNAHMSKMQKILSEHGGTTDGGGNRSDLSTIRWDIIDPGEPNANARFAQDLKQNGKRRGSIEEDVGSEADDKDDDGNAARAATAQNRRIASVDYASPNLNDKPRKPRGRPRIHPLDGDRTKRHASVNVTTPSGTPRPRTPASGIPATLMSSGTGGKGTGYAAFGPQYDENGKRKLGRPVGWRKNVHSYAAQGIPPPKPYQSAKAASRLRQSDTPRAAPVQPHYAIYKCEWSDCSAELHNLETLKKHLVKFHGITGEDGSLRCLWSGCQSRGLFVNAQGKRAQRGDGSPATFERIETWLDHTQSEHLQSLAWELGDGPKSDHTPHDSDAYLSDAKGRSVTPVIMPPPPRDTTQQMSKVYTNKEERKMFRAAEELLNELRRQKQAEGFIMGQESSKLVNQKRRLGFLDDEDFEDVIETDEE